MARVLAIANQTLGQEPLLALLSKRAAAGDEVFVLVPASGPSADERALRASEHLRVLPGESENFSVARWRLRVTLERLTRRGVVIDGDVAVPDPVRAVSHILAWRSFDEIVLSTLPRRTSRWMAMDVPRRLRRRFGLPVLHIEAAEPTGGHGAVMREVADPVS